MESPAKGVFQQSLTFVGRAMAVCAAVFVIMAHEGFGPDYFGEIGKALFWTAMVFVPLFSINQDMLQLGAGKFLAVVLFVIQLTLVYIFFRRLNEFNFITLAPLAFCQSLAFAIAFMFIRKQHHGIWY